MCIRLSNNTLAAILAAIAVLSSSAGEKIEKSPLYKDASQPIAVRVNDLLGRMTLDEKIGQTNQRSVAVDRKSTRLNSSHMA